MKRSALSIAWLFLGVLAIASVLITLGKRGGQTNPRIDSYGPSGFHALADLLRQNGYPVTRTSSALPDLQKGDIVVACVDEEKPGLLISDKDSGALGRVSDFTERGGRLIVLPLTSEFGDGPETIKTTAENNTTKESFSVVMRDPERSVGAVSFLPDDLTSATIWDHADTRRDVDAQAIGTLTQDGKGIVLRLSDGFIGSNRFIDQEQNANLLLNMVASIAPKGSRIVFAEATFSGEVASLVEMLGPGVTAVWYQTLFLFLVVVFTLGMRFGLPELVRPAQTGQRELVDAIADTYRRARSTRVACRAAYDRADAEIRKALKLSSDAPASERDQRLPEEVAQAFRKVFEGTIDVLPPQDAFLRCQSLRRQVQEFLHRPLI